MATTLSVLIRLTQRDDPTKTPFMLSQLPYISQSIPGIDGIIKSSPEDFIVEEIPLYEPVGHGEHLFLRIRKRRLSTEELLTHIENTLNLDRTEIGVAGQKDKYALTTQTLSLPIRFEKEILKLECDDIQILNACPHTNKLKTGHLSGNHFTTVVRTASANALKKAKNIADLLFQTGFPNYFGQQRFGRDGANVKRGLELLKGQLKPSRIPYRRRKYLLRLYISAVQSELFNLALTHRILQGLFSTVIDGDVMKKTDTGGLFVTTDAKREQIRFEQQEIDITGPIFGHKMTNAAGKPQEFETSLLSNHCLDATSLKRFPKLSTGTRRPFHIFPRNWRLQQCSEGIQLSFTLAPGQYATTVLREFIRN